MYYVSDILYLSDVLFGGLSDILKFGGVLVVGLSVILILLTNWINCSSVF